MLVAHASAHGSTAEIASRLAESLAGLDEVRHFARRFGVDDASDARAAFRLEKAAPIGDDRDRAAGKAGVGAQHLGRVFGLELGIIASVENAEDDLFHVIWQAMIVGKHSVDIGDIARGWMSLRRGRRL